jgi:microcystin-dependent protein
MSYNINFTDPANPDPRSPLTVQDQELNQETNLTFVGKNYTGYSQFIAENFLHLLENFASPTEPQNAVSGQIWYDTGTNSVPAQPQLKVYDGTRFVAAGNVKKSISAPGASSAVLGDLWVDTANQQLSLWSGSSWILVGPQFSEGTQSGPKIETIIDTTAPIGISHTVISLVVADETVAIISKDAFTPKTTIEGFATIKQGINISTKDFDSDGTVLNKLWGTAETANSLLIGNNSVAATNFLRSDTASVTNYGLGIRNNAGLTLGSDLSTSLSTTQIGESVLYNKTEGSSIFVRIRQSGTDKDIITVSGTNVGINKTNPTEALDITGAVKVSDNLSITGTTNSTNLITGSLQTAGGAAVTKNLYVGQNLSVAGTAATGALTVTGALAASGAITAPTVTATTFNGTFVGQLSGSVTGTATQLASPTVFQLTGDMSSNAISFTGAQVGGVATFTTVLNSNFINSKTSVLDSVISDELIIHRIGTGLRKTNKQTFLSNVATVPAGALLPFAGTTVPNGYLLCDGSEQLISSYPELFAAIGYTYKPIDDIVGVSTFGLPDLRGRFPLGKDSMNNGTTVPLLPLSATYVSGAISPSVSLVVDNTTGIVANMVITGTGFTSGQTVVSVTNSTTIVISASADSTPSGVLTFSYAAEGETIDPAANRVTDVTADTVGMSSGTEETTLDVSNLPEHSHNLQGNAGGQYYAFRNAPGAPDDTNAFSGLGATAAATGQYLNNSGPIDTAGTVGVPFNTMNPYLTINYIIFTGRII